MRLIEPNIKEVSYVDRPASGKTWNIVKNSDGSVSWSTYVPFAKANDDRLVVGVAYYPGSPVDLDKQGDWADRAAVREMMESFDRNGRQLNLMHEAPAEGAEVVRSYIQDGSGRIGAQMVADGSWVLETRVTNDALYERIKTGKLNGYSVGGTAKYCENDEPSPEERAELDALMAQANEAARKLYYADELAFEECAEVVVKSYEDTEALGFEIEALEAGATPDEAYEFAQLCKSIKKLTRNL